MNNPIKTHSGGVYVNANEYSVITSSFTVFLNGVLTTVVIQDDGLGNLHYYTVDSNGNKLRTGNAVGTVDYTTGTLNIVANIYDYSNYIKVQCYLQNQTIQIMRQSFIIAASNDINVEPIAQ